MGSDSQSAETSSNTSQLGDDSGKRAHPTKSATSRDHKRTTVRFTDGEYERIKEEARLLGESIPLILKRSHFSKRKLTILFDFETRHFICKELRRIGSNVNQIARRVNSGALEGWHPEFEKAHQAILELLNLVSPVYGTR